MVIEKHANNRLVRGGGIDAWLNTGQASHATRGVYPNLVALRIGTRGDRYGHAWNVVLGSGTAVL
jgi:hypothetical protein